MTGIKGGRRRNGGGTAASPDMVVLQLLLGVSASAVSCVDVGHRCHAVTVSGASDDAFWIRGSVRHALCLFRDDAQGCDFGASLRGCRRCSREQRVRAHSRYCKDAGRFRSGYFAIISKPMRSRG